MLDNNSINLGLIAGNMSIMHLGHYKLIERASQECDGVIIFVSKSGRENIVGTKVETLWKEYFEPALPNNTKVNLCDNSPIKELYKFIAANTQKDPNNIANKIDYRSYKIYSEITDIRKNFNNLPKYFPSLCEQNKISVVPIQREETCLISGKQMRNFIDMDDFNSFKQFLPENVQSQKVWDFIKNKPLVDFIKVVLDISRVSK